MTVRQRVPRKLAFAALSCACLAAPAFADPPVPQGYPGRGRIGIEVQPMTAELREFFAAPSDEGLLVVRVEPGRPAETAGVRVGDVVIAAAGEPLVRPHDLVAIVARAPAGEPLELKVVRQKQTQAVEVRPEGEPATAEALRAWHERIGEPLAPQIGGPVAEPTPMPAAAPAPDETAGPLAPDTAAPTDPSSAPVAPARVTPAPAP